MLGDSFSSRSSNFSSLDKSFPPIRWMSTMSLRYSKLPIIVKCGDSLYRWGNKISKPWASSILWWILQLLAEGKKQIRIYTRSLELGNHYLCLGWDTAVKVFAWVCFNKDQKCVLRHCDVLTHFKWSLTVCSILASLQVTVQSLFC